jgi:hypothetical protein
VGGWWQMLRMDGVCQTTPPLFWGRKRCRYSKPAASSLEETGQKQLAQRTEVAKGAKTRGPLETGGSVH